jgi:hypothetical protein
VITSAILLDRHITLWTFFRVGSDPIRRLGIIIALFNPLAQQTTLHWIVPLFGAFEAENVTALALDGTRVYVLNFHSVTAISRWTPAKESIAFDETVGDELLVFGANARFRKQIHYRHIVHQNITAVSSASD